MFGLPILDNCIPVPDSWAAAKESGCSSFFAGPDERCRTCGSRRYITATLACWGCANPPVPKWGDVAPDRATALARGFSHYRGEPCPSHPDSVYLTATRRCVECQREEDAAAHAERVKERELEKQREATELAKLRREENRLWKAGRAEAEKAERALRVITRTVRGSKRKTLARALKMEAEL